jgi:hypothetical protein
MDTLSSLKAAIKSADANGVSEFINGKYSNGEWLQVIDELTCVKSCDDYDKVAQIVLSNVPTTFPFPLKYFSIPEFREVLFKYLNEAKITAFTKMFYRANPYVCTFPDWILLSDGRINSVLYSEIFNTLLHHAAARKLNSVYNVFEK